MNGRDDLYQIVLFLKKKLFFEYKPDVVKPRGVIRNSTFGGKKMFNYNNPTIIFTWVLGFYFIPLIVGLFLGKKKVVSTSNISEIGKYLADPITKKIHNWSRKYKMSCLKNKSWFLLFLLIFLNNLLLAAFITKILYGVIFIIPLLLTAWEGFGHGVVFSKPKARGGIILTFFEFGGYLFATVIGVKLGIIILETIIYGNQLIINVPWIYVLLTIGFLVIGAIIESFSMKTISKKVDLSTLDKVDFEKRKEEMAKYIEEGE